MSFRVSNPTKQKLNSVVALQLDQPLVSTGGADGERIRSLFDDEDEKATEVRPQPTVIQPHKADGFSVRVNSNADLQ